MDYYSAGSKNIEEILHESLKLSTVNMYRMCVIVKYSNGNWLIFVCPKSGPDRIRNLDSRLHRLRDLIPCAWFRGFGSGY